MASKHLFCPLVIVPILLGSCTAGFVDGSDSIATDNYANASLEYYYYIPQSVSASEQATHPVLIMVPGLSGRGKDFVSQEFKAFADREAFVIVAPSFMYDEANWDSQRSYQYPSAWSGQALWQIIKQVETKHEITTSQFYLFGFSAGAQFSLRFCLWWPKKCAACAAHAGGGTIIPDRRVDVSFFVTAGTQDPERLQKAQSFYQTGQSLGIDVSYKAYTIGHALTSEQIEDSLQFFATKKR
jgi:predicted esterase